MLKTVSKSVGCTLFARRSSQSLCRDSLRMGSSQSVRREDSEWEVVERTAALLTSSLSPRAQRDTNVIKFMTPDEMKDSLGLNNEDVATKSTVDELMTLCEKVVSNSVKTGNPMFLNQLYRGCDAFGLAASLLSEFLNTNAHTFEVAPAFTMIERDVIDRLGRIVGFDQCEGIFTPGGSISCMYALNLARFKYDKTIKKMGIFNHPRMIVFASVQSHYAVTKGASFLGLGTDSVIPVLCDDKGAMDIEDLKVKVQAVSSNSNRDTVPLMVWATSGTTVLSGFDNLTLIANVCKQYNMWLHVDACVGGAFLLSKAHRHLLCGIGRSDSVTWNWHKLLGAPLQTSVFLTKHQDLLSEAHSCTATYLFHNVKHYDTRYDWGNSSVQCGRKTDAIKVWLMWKGRGSEELEQIVDDTVYMAHVLYKKMRGSPRFRMVLPHSQGTTVCFWVVPPSVRLEYTNKDEDCADYWKRVSGVALQLKRRMVKDGCMMLQYQPLPDKQLVDFFRVTLTCAPQFTLQDTDTLINNLVRLSEDL